MFPQFSDRYPKLEVESFWASTQETIQQLAWSNTGHELLVSSGHAWHHTLTSVDIMTMRADVRLRQTYFKMSASSAYPVVALAKETVAELYDYQNGLTITQVPLQHVMMNCWVPSWSPNGELVAFVGKKMMLNTIDRVINQLVMLDYSGILLGTIVDTRDILRVTWSPNSARVGIELTGQDLKLLDPRKLSLKAHVTDKTGFTFGPKPSQAYWWQVNQSAAHLVVNQNWDQENNLELEAEMIGSYAMRWGALPTVLWSPDGKWLLIIEGRGKSQMIMLYNLETGMREIVQHQWLQGATGFIWTRDSRGFAAITSSGHQVVTCYIV